MERTSEFRFGIGRRNRRGRTATGALLLAFASVSLAAFRASANTAPVIDSFSAPALAVLPGAAVPLTLQAHDPDCTTPPCTAGCGLYIRFDLTTFTPSGGAIGSVNAGTSASPYSASAVWTAPAVDGTYTVTASVSDSGTSSLCGGRMTSTSVLTFFVSATPNQAPVISSLSAGAAVLYPGQSTIVNAVASDPDGDPITFAWSTTAGTISPAAPGAATLAAPPSPAAVTVTCTVTDSKGASASKTLPVSVTSAMPERSIRAGLRAPQRVAINSAGEVFVVDPSLGGIAVVGLFTGQQNGFWPLQLARSVAVDWTDRIVVGGAPGAAVYDRTLTLVRVFDPGSPLGGVTDVAVDRAGRRYGLLYGDTGRIVVFGASGGPLFSFGANGSNPGELKGASSIAFTPAGDLLVGDRGHGLVQLYSGINGTFVHSYGASGSVPGAFGQVDGIASDAAGNLLAADGFLSVVHSFASGGAFQESLGGFGSSTGQLKTPAGLLVSDTFQRVVVASANASSLEVYRLPAPGAAAPVLALSTTLLPFGHQATSVSSASRTVTLMSVGTAPVSISNVYPSGDFFVTGNSCAGLLEPGRSCAVTLSFNPAAAGDRHGTATVVSNAPGSPATVFLTGTGVPGNGILVASVPNLHFGETPIGRTGAVQTVTLSASGGPLVLGSVRVAGSSPADFSITSDTCTGASLAQGSACTVSIAFSPTVTGLRSASLEIQGAAGAAAASVPLDGTGIAAPAAEGIPTLGEWGLGIFALALAAAGVGFLGRRA